MSEARRRGLVTLSLGPDIVAMLRWLPRRYVCEDGLPAANASEVVRDLIQSAYERTARRKKRKA